ncbi:MAG: nicotinate phosphoribosyltransferase [Coriobacteriales bacterium]|nr:nicotinate phosphoribosyltransferase [Coriobacteriales bacterium]
MLLNDLYQLTMAEGYWKNGFVDAQASFYMHFRNNPFQGGYTIACGMEHLSEIARNFEFTDDDVDYLKTLKTATGEDLFDRGFLEFLRSYKLTLDIDAPLEGSAIFPIEPVVRVVGPLIDCQLIETPLLNAINFETLIATKAARVCHCTDGAVAEFGLRRAQGPNGGLLASRASFIGGCASTSNVLAGKMFNIPVSGTHAHAWVQAFDTELEAFRAFASAMPYNTILLVDTYDIEEGLKNAIIVGKEMEERGERLIGIRIDSGDLAWGSKLARKMLDDAGLDYVKVTLTNDLDEHLMVSLKEQGACVDSWGIGTKLAVAYDQPALGGVYKMSAIKKTPDSNWEPKLKISAQIAKRTLPGLLDVKRFSDEAGNYIGDLVYDQLLGQSGDLAVDPFDLAQVEDFSGSESKQLLVPLVRGGEPVIDSFDAHEARERVAVELSRLDSSYTRFLNPAPYSVGLDPALSDSRTNLINEHKKDKKRKLKN